MTRSLADGFRLFATGLVLAALRTGLRMEPAAAHRFRGWILKRRCSLPR